MVSFISITFLGHYIDQHGAVPLPSKVEAIRKFPKPTTLKELQEFVSIVNFYHCFMPAAVKIMQPIFRVLANKPKELMWDNEATTAFDNAKEVLTEATMLVYPQGNTNKSHGRRI